MDAKFLVYLPTCIPAKRRSSAEKKISSLFLWVTTKRGPPLMDPQSGPPYGPPCGPPYGPPHKIFLLSNTLLININTQLPVVGNL